MPQAGTRTRGIDGLHVLQPFTTSKMAWTVKPRLWSEQHPWHPLAIGCRQVTFLPVQYILHWTAMDKGRGWPQPYHAISWSICRSFEAGDDCLGLQWMSDSLCGCQHPRAEKHWWPKRDLSGHGWTPHGWKMWESKWFVCCILLHKDGRGRERGDMPKRSRYHMVNKGWPVGSRGSDSLIPLDKTSLEGDHTWLPDLSHVFAREKQALRLTRHFNALT